MLVISDLNGFLSQEINMHSLVVVGNSCSYVRDGFLITPRGYRL
jgi:precorrin-3B C17-methyltransferase